MNEVFGLDKVINTINPSLDKKSIVMIKGLSGSGKTTAALNAINERDEAIYLGKFEQYSENNLMV